MRFVGLDVHRDFREVAIAEGGEVRRARRVQTEPAALALFAQSLGGEDQVALEATGNALRMGRIEPDRVWRGPRSTPASVESRFLAQAAWVSVLILLISNSIGVSMPRLERRRRR